MLRTVVSDAVSMAPLFLRVEQRLLPLCILFTLKELSISIELLTQMPAERMSARAADIGKEVLNYSLPKIHIQIFNKIVMSKFRAAFEPISALSMTGDQPLGQGNAG